MERDLMGVKIIRSQENLREVVLRKRGRNFTGQKMETIVSVRKFMIRLKTSEGF